MKIAFYTEAGTKRGMGHLIRCYTIYEQFNLFYKNTSFYLDSDINFNYKFNDIIYFKWNKLKYNKKFDIIFIDSYEASLDIYNQLSQNAKVAVYIDDDSRLNYPPGIILNFAPDANSLFFKHKSSKYTYMLGLGYIPIRKQFLSLKKQKQIFIMLGGSDVKNLSLDILNALDNIDIKKVIVINKNELFEQLQNYKNTIILHKPSDEELMSNMASSSIAISTASMTLYELAYLQIPTIIIAINTNQKNGAIQLIKHKIAIQFIDMNDMNWKTNMKHAINSLNDHILNNKIDGKGTQRIVNTTINIFKEKSDV